MTPRQTYDMLAETGELMVMYDEFNFTGKWNKDKELFLKVHEANEVAIKEANGFVVDLDEDDE